MRWKSCSDAEKGDFSYVEQYKQFKQQFFRNQSKLQIYIFSGQSTRINSDPKIKIIATSNSGTQTTLLELTSTTADKISTNGMIVTTPGGLFYNIWDGTGWKTDALSMNLENGSVYFQFYITGPFGSTPQASVLRLTSST